MGLTIESCMKTEPHIKPLSTTTTNTKQHKLCSKNRTKIVKVKTKLNRVKAKNIEKLKMK